MAYSHVVAILKELLVVNKDSLTYKSLSNKIFNILTMLKKYPNTKISEAFEFYIFLKFERGAYRELGISYYFHELEEFNQVLNNYCCQIIALYYPYEKNKHFYETSKILSPITSFFDINFEKLIKKNLKGYKTCKGLEHLLSF